MLSAGIAALALLAAVLASTASARVGNAAGVAQSSLVNAVPGDNTPNIKDGATYAIAKVGGKIIVGGTFTSVVNHGTSTAMSRYKILAFDASTGKVDDAFQPALNVASNTVVNALAPGPDGHSVYVGGIFSTVNGVNRHNLALIDTDTGAAEPGFTPSAPNGSVGALRVVGSRLLIGGTFTSVGGVKHDHLASLSATTGDVDDYMGVDLTEHHNYTGADGEAEAPVGVDDMDVSPDGDTLVVVGNFKKADGLARDQIVRITLGSESATVDPDWATDAYTPRCSADKFDGYVRGVGFSPDGSYFVVVATGGSGGLPATETHCDAAARFDTGDSGSSVDPAWTDWTGRDTLLSVAVTGTAVYVGGHERWLNNPDGTDDAGGGAVPRPGIGALDPRTGVPLSWNPGRNPRGVGARALLATGDGLYVGMDTDYIGDHKYFRGKIAYFPLAGGKSMPPENIGSLPGNLYTAHSDGVAYRRSYDGSTFGGKTSVPGAGSWVNVRGGFMVNGKLYYGNKNGFMYWRTFDGATFGSYSTIDPYDDPTWVNVQTGHGETYRGMVPSFYAELSDVTGMVYRDGRIYYVLGSKAKLYWRDFSPDSGVTGQIEHEASDMGRWKTSGGMFLDGDTLYYTSRTTGNMYKTPWLDGKPDAPVTQVSGPSMDGKGWKNTILFLYAG
ncbi:MAG TPA: hypothetical protein VF053_02085 [Streptosporangiales bacterium]